MQGKDPSPSEQFVYHPTQSLGFNWFGKEPVDSERITSILHEGLQAVQVARVGRHEGAEDFADAGTVDKRHILEINNYFWLFICLWRWII